MGLLFLSTTALRLRSGELAAAWPTGIGRIDFYAVTQLFSAKAGVHRFLNRALKNHNIDTVSVHHFNGRTTSTIDKYYSGPRFLDSGLRC